MRRNHAVRNEAPPTPIFFARGVGSSGVPHSQERHRERAPMLPKVGFPELM